MAEPVISVKGLRKSYGDLEAVRGIDLEVRSGEIFAFLGPNGAGKTTTVEILEGYRDRERRRGQRARHRPAAGGPRLAQPGRFRPSGLQARPRAHRRARRSSNTPATTPTLATWTRQLTWSAWRRRRTPGPRRSPVASSAGWTCAGAGRRPRAALPGRADDRLRPLGAPPGLGRDRRPAQSRQDRLPHHALHGRGPGARRPGGHHLGRADRRDRVARASWAATRGAHRDQLPASGTASPPRTCPTVCAPPPGSTPRRSR